MLDPRMLFRGFYETVWRIISHCFVLTGFFPVSMCCVGVHMMLTGKASSKTIIASFLDHIVERERSVVQKVIAGQQLKNSDTLCFCPFQVFMAYYLPKQKKLSTVENVAATSLLCKQRYCYGRILADMNAYPQ